MAEVHLKVDMKPSREFVSTFKMDGRDLLIFYPNNFEGGLEHEPSDRETSPFSRSLGSRPNVALFLIFVTLLSPLLSVDFFKFAGHALDSHYTQ